MIKNYRPSTKITRIYFGVGRFHRVYYNKGVRPSSDWIDSREKLNNHIEGLKRAYDEYEMNKAQEVE